MLRDKIELYKVYHHNKNYTKDEKYIIWIRNPINRFVSAFNHSYYGINTDVSNIKTLNFNNCLIPARMEKALKTKDYVFSPNYDRLMRSFKTANELAEGLTSSDISIKKRAEELMNCIEEHFLKGIGWYLNNGIFVKNRHKRIIFVGRQENMKEDILELGKILNVSLDENKKVRENIYVDKSMKYLSQTAIENIKEWYKSTDYWALNELHNYGFITKEVLDSYNTYFI